MNSVTFGNSIIKYNVKRVTNRKTTQIFVDKLGVQIISPSKTTQKEIKDIVIKNSKWIYSKQLWANKQSDMKISFKQGTRLPYLGKNYLLKIKESNNEKSNHFFLSNKFFFLMHHL